MGGECASRRLPLTGTHQHETRPASQRRTKRRQSMCRASASLRRRGMVRGHNQATMELACQRIAIEQQASHTENDQGHEPFYESHTPRLEDDSD